MTASVIVLVSTSEMNFVTVATVCDSERENRTIFACSSSLLSMPVSVIKTTYRQTARPTCLCIFLFRSRFTQG